MDNWIKSPWFTRIVSLFLALLLYTTVAIDEANKTRPGDTFLPPSSANTEIMENVPLIVDLDHDDYVIRGVPDTVNVSIEGPRSVVTQTVRQRNFEVFIDLNDLGPGTHEVDVHHRGLSSQLTVFIEPMTINVVIEERATVTLPVDIEFVGDQQFDLQEVFASPPTVTPGEVEITGSVTEVDKIAIVKAIVEFADLAEDGIARNIPIKVYDTQGNDLNVFINPSTVTIEADVSVSNKNFTLDYETKGELNDSLVLKSIRITPRTVTLFGADNRLEEITELPPISIDLSSITESTTINADLLLPRGTTKIEPEVVEVEIEVVQAVEKTFENIEIDIENLGEEEDIIFVNPDEPYIDVIATGASEEIEKISSDDIRAWIDVKDYVEGEFFVEVKIDGPENIRLRAKAERVHVRKE
ncbi:CdaR family protein [Bacillaceae bacterium W0354]